MANTMKAACYKQLGGPEVLEILDLEIPEPEGADFDEMP